MYKIGVVDDDVVYCFAIQRFLSREFVVSVFTKFSSFLQEKGSYDLLIIDYCIPSANYEKEMDGCQLIYGLKANLPNPPILVLSTGFLSESNLEMGKEICPEADSFFAKEAGLEAILQHIKQLLTSKKERSPLKTFEKVVSRGSQEQF